jgi:hypothetical protein
MSVAQEQAEALQQAEQQIDFDPETVDLEQLRQEALRQEAQPEGEQPRDEQGRFVSQNPPKKGDSSNEVEEVDEIVYRKVIDLGDGSGVQVFEGTSQDEVIEKLATAQLNATRKIRELSQAKKEEPKPVERTPEEEWLLSQELLSSPSKTVEKLFEQVTGMPVKAFKSKLERLNAFEQAQSEEAAAREFMSKHPEFVPSPANARKIEKYVRTYNLDGTKAESIEQAFMDLNESGLLEVKAAQQQQQQQAQQEPEAAQQSRIATQAQQPARTSTTRMSSGISARRSTAQRSAPEPTEDDLYNLPLDKLRALAISEANQQ